MMKKAFTLLALALTGAACTRGAEDYSFSLRNKLSIARENETVEVGVPRGTRLPEVVLTLNRDGTEIPFEAVGDTAIRFQANLAPGGSEGYTLKKGSPTSPAKRTFAGIEQPETRHDIAWENDRAAYRMYSYVLKQREATTGNGVDLWQKKKPEPVVEDMYNLPDFHTESEYGVDGYNVNGLRLGNGGVSHLAGEDVPVVHKPYDKCEILENGALKSEFVLTYDNVEVDGEMYTKTLRIIATAGSLLNKAIVRYDGPEKPMRLAATVYEHTDIPGVTPDGVPYTSTPGLAGWAENPSEGNITSSGVRFYQAAYMPSCASQAEDMASYLCLTVDYTPGTDLVFYFGGGWNIYPEGEYQQDNDWFLALDRFKQIVDSPIVVETREGR
ncbi:MAG: DUF4861 domain-containing protein [Prevotellaceae bacterium]|nr:DUF4861 domain-containing protein [Prevotellaceae bacterium]